MEAIIVNHDRIYGSIGLYIPLSLDSRQTYFSIQQKRASQPLPNQSSMQGRESKKKSNIQQFRMAMRNFRMAMQNFRKACEMPKKNTSCRTESKTVKNEFRTLCEISQALRNQRLRKMNFAPCPKFRKPCENPLV